MKLIEFILVQTHPSHGYVFIFKDEIWGTRHIGNIDFPFSLAIDNYLQLKLAFDDYSNTRGNFQFTVGCMIKSSKTIYTVFYLFVPPPKKNLQKPINCKISQLNKG